jgi:hypothetical protein
MIVLCASMQKSGSLWFLNMVNDLLIDGGHQDFRAVRARYRLGWFVRESGHMPVLRLHKAPQILMPHFRGETFAINTHSRPGLTVKGLIKLGIIRAIYLFRDPRDVARSLFEHGEDLRARGIRSSTTFDRLQTLEQAIDFTAKILPIGISWLGVSGVHALRYEALRQDPVHELTHVSRFLGLELPPGSVERIVSKYDASNIRSSEFHLNKAIVGRWKAVMTQEQIEHCNRSFGEHMERIGYE